MQGPAMIVSFRPLIRFQICPSVITSESSIREVELKKGMLRDGTLNLATSGRHSGSVSETLGTEAPRIVAELLQRAETVGASDIHLQTTPEGLEVAFRLDGLLTRVESFESALAERLLGRIKYLAKLQTWQESSPQDGRIGRDEAGTRTDIRVATYPTVTGEKVVLRMFTADEVPTIAELGLSEDVRTQLEGFLRQPAGLLLLTGPAGSGKSTTIYACLRELSADNGRHIITIEDPVERVLPGVMQTEVNEPQGLTYPKAARHLLRQDPQVLVLGEIRDDESAQIAVRTALTGHLVISTLHAGSCQGVLERLWSMVPDKFTVASAVSLVINQRLVRRVCKACQGAKCDVCVNTGYHGRMPVAEWIAVSDEVKARLRKEGPVGMGEVASDLNEQARALVANGDTTPAEMDRVIGAC
jgi:general secretion pathway protein E